MDFTLSDNDVTFGVNDETESIDISITDDSVYEGQHNCIVLTLEDPLYTDGHGNLREPYSLTINIQDDDGTYIVLEIHFKQSLNTKLKLRFTSIFWCDVHNRQEYSGDVMDEVAHASVSVLFARFLYVA